MVRKLDGEVIGARQYELSGDGWEELPYGILVYTMAKRGPPMKPARKITVEVPAELLKKAQDASGAGITQTVRTGLELIAASRTYARLLDLRGKVVFSRTLSDLKADR